MMTNADSIPPPGPGPEQQALHAALAGFMASVARLAVARGLPYAGVEEMLRLAFVQAASHAFPGLPEHRKVSRISTSTGINRREVTRLVGLLNQPAAPAPAHRSAASEVFAHWRALAPYRDRKGQPKVLPRQGRAPSFETLAHAVTRDVHPRSLLDELCRLRLAVWDEASDTVALAREAFVPQGDRAHLLGLLGDNVGDHLRAAVDNVLRDDRLHFEQAVFAGGLSAESLEALRPAVRAAWQGLLAALVPALEDRVEHDAGASPPALGRMRVGLYTYQEAGALNTSEPNPPALPARRPARKAPRS